MSLQEAVSSFGIEARAKLSNPAAIGAPEDQLRAPLEKLLVDLAELVGFAHGKVVLVGETSLSDLKTRPDYAVTRDNALVGFIEVKAPGKGADPRRFNDSHDADQWVKLQSLPNLIYTDGNCFSLWRNGALEGKIVELEGDVALAGKSLSAPDGLLALLADFLHWEPQPPQSAAQLAVITARLCRLLREEVTEQLGRGSASLTNLAQDWRKLLFPSATDAAFADGYAQAVTFGLLMARAQEIRLADGLGRAALKLRQTNTLIGAALRLLTDDVDNETTLKTSLATLTRVLDAVHWPAVSKGDPEAWLYFYEQFLRVYDNELRKKTGSYYTPPDVVRCQVRLVDEALRSDERFSLSAGFASPEVTVVDPATGTGTYILGVLRRIADATAADLGPGAVRAVIQDAASRIIGFEIQFGPFAVAQLRVLAELKALAEDQAAAPAMRLYVTDTLGNPFAEEEYLPQILKPIGESRRRANEIKRQEKITVVIGNPPYKEKAKGLGGWIESGSTSDEKRVPLGDWRPPPAWSVGAHAKHLRNLYVYFWRWAVWKVFEDGDPASVEGRAVDQKGIVSFITVAGFLNGPGFEKMRAELRRQADEIWVIDCSPEGHQPKVATRIFQDVQQPVCIVMAARGNGSDATARVKYRALPRGDRTGKFAALDEISLDGDGWTECASEPRASFLPRAAGDWEDCAALEDLFVYNGAGVMPGRTWVIAPDRETLARRWERLQSEADAEKKETLFHPHLRQQRPGDRHLHKEPHQGLQGHDFRAQSVAADTKPVIRPTRYAFRSFDRQWIIPDVRLINQPNPTLWELHSNDQVYMTALHRHSPSGGPAVTFCAEIPDLHHYKGSFGGRLFPMWCDRQRRTTNVKPGLLREMTEVLGIEISGPDFMAYVAGLAAHPAYTARFQADLVQPGLRVPLTSESSLFREAVDIGREIIWLHCFGERFADANVGRPKGPPRMPIGAGPVIPKTGAIPTGANQFPDRIEYDGGSRRLKIGEGFVENVPAAVWEYKVSGKPVLVQWFSYRRLDRSRPIIGTRRQPSSLHRIQPDCWQAEYTTELMNLLHVLGWLVGLENRQADLLERICGGTLIAGEDLRARGAFDFSAKVRRRQGVAGQGLLLE